jgi:hypothetical protein
MTQVNYNCIVCAEEFDLEELQSVGSINSSSFKICQACVDMSDPADDYYQVREIINSYLRKSEAKTLFTEVKNILSSRKL